MSELAPIVEHTTKLSDEQRPAVAAGGDVAVTAGAGAGKTRTLVARYLSLLAEGLSPRQVVAITFTKKAAREMRNRVRDEVNRYLQEGKLSDGEQARWQEVYSGLDAARIGTIHSLCGEILRRHPAEAGLDPRFEMLDEGQMALLQAQAVEEALVWAADDEHVAPLYRLWPERDLRQALGGLLAKRLDVEDAFRTLPTSWTELRERWQTAIAAAREEARSALLSDPEFDAALELVRLAQPQNAGDKLVVQIQQLLAVLGEVGTPDAEALAALDGIRLNVGSAQAWPGGKEELREIKDALGTMRDHYRAAREWLELAWSEADQALLEQYGALRDLYAHAAARYEALKAEGPFLDFDDLEARAVDLLCARDDVAAAWQAEIAALLVDEFQDTNRRQRALLDALNGGAVGHGVAGKLFIVGDAKQSIYRFRGADVTVFREKQRDIRRHGRTYDLSTSYRGHRALIEALNALLEPVLGLEEDAARPYVEPFSPIGAFREDPGHGVRAPYVELHLALGSKSDGALDRAAQALAARLAALVEGNRELNYDDVALLCRATRSFPAYERAFEEAGIPFVTVAGRGFYERPEVRDLLNALQALDDPSDDLALAGLLRSPACGLSDVALLRLVDLRRARELPSLWAALCCASNDAQGPSPLAEEADLGARACALIDALRAQVGRVPVADVLKAFLDRTAYRAALLRAGQARGARNVTKLLADAQRSERVSVGAFLDYLGQLRDVGTREGEAYALSEGAVQIMSVHAAKGLEFPIVCIGEASRGDANLRGTEVDVELGVLPPLALERVVDDEAQGVRVETISPALYRLARRASLDQDEAESGRLLYVAATRAKEALLISGVVGRSASGWLKRLGAELPLDAALKEADAEGDAVTQATWPLGGQAIACSLYPKNAELRVSPVAARPGPALDLPAAPPLLEPLRGETLHADAETRDQSRDPPRRVWRVVPPEGRPTAPAWVVGQLVHGALADWLFPDRAARDYPRWAEAAARGYGITDEGELKNAVQRAARMLTRFQGTGLYSRMEGAEVRRHEVPYSLLGADGAWERGVIDALFYEKGPDGGQWTVVEFKTDRLRSEKQVEQKLAEVDYVPQVQCYLDAGERLLGVRPQPVLCLLNVAGTVRLVEDRW